MRNPIWLTVLTALMLPVVMPSCMGFSIGDPIRVTFEQAMAAEKEQAVKNAQLLGSTPGASLGTIGDWLPDPNNRQYYWSGMPDGVVGGQITAGGLRFDTQGVANALASGQLCTVPGETLADAQTDPKFMAWYNALLKCDGGSEAFQRAMAYNAIARNQTAQNQTVQTVPAIQYPAPPAWGGAAASAAAPHLLAGGSNPGECNGGTCEGGSGQQQTSFGPLILINASSVTALEHQVGPFTISFDPGHPYKSIRATGPFRLLGPDGKTWYTHYVLFCYSNSEGVMVDTLIQLNKFDLPVFDLGGEYPTKAVYSDLVSKGADTNTIYVVQRLIDGKPGVFGWGYLSTAKMQEYSINWYISPTSVAHVEVWDEQEAGNILNSIHIDNPTAFVNALSNNPSSVPAASTKKTPVSAAVAASASPVYTQSPGSSGFNAGW